MDKKKEVRALREQGITIRDIAERMNIPKSMLNIGGIQASSFYRRIGT